MLYNEEFLSPVKVFLLICYQTICTNPTRKQRRHKPLSLSLFDLWISELGKWLYKSTHPLSFVWKAQILALCEVTRAVYCLSCQKCLDEYGLIAHDCLTVGFVSPNTKAFSHMYTAWAFKRTTKSTFTISSSPLFVLYLKAFSCQCEVIGLKSALCHEGNQVFHQTVLLWYHNIHPQIMKLNTEL